AKADIFEGRADLFAAFGSSYIDRGLKVGAAVL
ncbi:MAG: hypothetical protein JWQ69_303, partial [Pseudomonas sp.]|nr:hypothetical protein [Pseudomonas sp.]